MEWRSIKEAPIELQSRAYALRRGLAGQSRYRFVMYDNRMWVILLGAMAGDPPTHYISEPLPNEEY